MQSPKTCPEHPSGRTVAKKHPSQKRVLSWRRRISLSERAVGCWESKSNSNHSVILWRTLLDSGRIFCFLKSKVLMKLHCQRLSLYDPFSPSHLSIASLLTGYLTKLFCCGIDSLPQSMRIGLPMRTRNTRTLQAWQGGTGVTLFCGGCRMLLLLFLMAETSVGEYGPFLLP